MTSAPLDNLDPLATGTADDLRDLLVRHIGDGVPGDGMDFWRARMATLVAEMSPILVWLRDHTGVRLHFWRCYALLGLREIATLCDRKVALISDPATGYVREIDVEGLPASLFVSMRAYLADLPGYDVTMPFDKQQSDRAREQHGYALFTLHQGLRRATSARRAA